MKHSLGTTRYLYVSFGFLSLAAMSYVHGAEHRVKRSDLPPAVNKTVEKESAGAAIRGLSEETDHGQTRYEVELSVDGHSKDVLIDETGVVVEVEEQVALESLPEAVRQGLVARAGNGKIASVETLTRNGILVAYEAYIRTGVKMSEIEINPQGQVLESGK